MNVRAFQKEDTHYVIGVDIKSGLTPTLMEDMGIALAPQLDWVRFVATVNDTPRAFVIAAEYNTELYIARFGVNPAFHGMGRGTGLLDQLDETARRLGLESLVISIPEIFCGGEEDISQWWLRKGFTYKSTDKALFIIDGTTFDGYNLERKVK